jgi:hypothetical protein
VTPQEPVLRAGTLALYDGLFAMVKVRITRVWYEEELVGRRPLRRPRVEFMVTSTKSVAFPRGTVEQSSIHWIRQRNGAAFDTIEVTA